MENIDAVHPDYEESMPDWEIIRDNLGGERMIKSKRHTYLPQDNPTGGSDSNERYDAMLKRALYFPATRQTLTSLIGRAFSSPPVYTGPDELINLINNIDGEGVTAEQQSKEVLSNVLPYSRAGLFVDYPTTEGPTTLADMEEGFVSPKIISFDPQRIINWDTVTVGAKTMLSFVMLKEDYTSSDDGYEKEVSTQYRELRLNDSGNYTVTIWRADDSAGWQIHGDVMMPTKGDGMPFKEIPFVFVGSEKNNQKVDFPQFIDLANVNLSHYRNSADEEQGLHDLQGTLVLSGTSNSWNDKYFPGGKVPIGSGACILLADGGSASFITPPETSSYSKAMRDKEDQMRAIGARFVEKGNIARTATEATIDEVSETSVLASNCNNVSAAYARALDFACQFSNIENTGTDYPNGATFKIDTSFAVIALSPEAQSALINSHNSGLLTYEEGRAQYRDAGMTLVSDEEAKATLEAQEESEFQAARQAFSQPPTE